MYANLRGAVALHVQIMQRTEQWRIQGRGSGGGGGGGGGGPRVGGGGPAPPPPPPRLFLDQTEPRRAEKYSEYADWPRIISVLNPY